MLRAQMKDSTLQFEGFYWFLLLLASLLGFSLIRWGRTPLSRWVGAAVVGLVLVTLAYASYQVVRNFRRTDLLTTFILVTIPAGIVCIKWKGSQLVTNFGIFLLCLAGAIAAYIVFLIIIALSINGS